MLKYIILIIGFVIITTLVKQIFHRADVTKSIYHDDPLQDLTILSMILIILVLLPLLIIIIFNIKYLFNSGEWASILNGLLCYYGTITVSYVAILQNTRLMKNQVRELEIKETELKNDIIPYLFIDHIEYCQGLKKHKVYDLDYTDAFCDIRQISTNYSFKDGEYEADLHIEADDTAAIKIFLKNGSSYSMSNINFIDLRSFSKYKDKSNREFYDYDYSYIHIPDAVIVTSQKMVIKPIVILINDKLFEYREIFSKNDESFEYHGELQKRLEISFCNQYGHFYKHNYNICLTKVKSEEQIHFSFRLSDVTYYERMETFQMTRKIAQDRQRNNVQIIDNSPDL